jgi:hypothetical protein
MKPQELKSFISDAMRQLHFDHESDGATILAEMTRGLYEHYGELRFNSHVKGFMLIPVSTTRLAAGGRRC